jgi:hypothetical protein
MSETILRDALAEKERMRDRLADQDRIAAGERSHAVLLTRFDAWIERAVQGEDLKELKREMEAEVNKQIELVFNRFNDKTEQQSKDILGRTAEMFQMQQAQIAEANRRTRVEILRYGVAFATSVLGALTVIWLTR